MIEKFVKSKLDFTLRTGAGGEYNLAVGEGCWVLLKNEKEFDNFVGMGLLEDGQIKTEFVHPAIVPGNSNLDIPVVGSHDTIQSIESKVLLTPSDLENGILEAISGQKEKESEPEDVSCPVEEHVSSPVPEDVPCLVQEDESRKPDARPVVKKIEKPAKPVGKRIVSNKSK